MDSLADIGRMKGAESKSTKSVQTIAQESAPKMDYAAQKELEKQKKRLAKKVADCEKEVEKISNEIKDLEEWMSTPQGAQNPAMFEEYGKLKAKLADAEQRWEEAMIEAEG